MMPGYSLVFVVFSMDLEPCFRFYSLSPQVASEMGVALLLILGCDVFLSESLISFYVTQLIFNEPAWTNRKIRRTNA